MRYLPASRSVALFVRRMDALCSMRLKVFFHSAEGLTVELTDAKFLDRLPMLFRAVTLMPGEIILGILLVIF